MKNLILYFTFLLNAIVFQAKAEITENASMSLNCPTTAVTPGSNFFVDVAFQYSTNSTGNIVLVVNYDNTKVSFCGSPGLSLVTPVDSGSSVTYTFPALLGNSPSTNIQMCFSFICPQTCFGSSLSANFTGTISTPTLTNIPANSCTTSGTVLNNWTSSNNVFAYDCINNIVTFQLRLGGSTCYKIDNPSLTITPSIGTLVATPTLPTSIYPTPYNYYYYYSIQLPCTTTSGTLSCSAVLNGNNCGTPVSSVVNFGIANWTISNSILSSLIQSTNATSNTVQVTNNGSLPISINLSTIIPLVNVTTISINSDQTTTLSGTTKLFNCSNTLISTTPFTVPPVFNITPSALINKADYTFLNLLPGKSIYIAYTFDKTINCAGTPPTDCHKFITSGDYLTYTPSPNCNCITLPPQTYTTVTTEYCPLPKMTCTNSSNYSSPCKEKGNILNFCFKFLNYGTAALQNGVFTFPLPAYLNYSGNLTFNGSTSGISVTAPPAGTAGNVIITLPPSISVGSGWQNLCFDVTVNSSAPNGLYGYNYTLSGTNLPIGTQYCPTYVRICQNPNYIIEKLVKGNKDTSFVSSGNGTAGSIATYQIKIRNTGNTPISNIEIIDRTPQTGDKTIRTCTLRNSNFSMFPTGIFNPSTLIPKYATSISGNNMLPPSWSSIGGICNNYSGVFTTTPIQNTVKINLSSPILPFTDYTFEMDVTIPSTATAGELACNTVGVKCDYLDIIGTPYPMEIKESNLACLTIAPPPCDNCKDLLSNTSFTVNPGTTSSASLPYVIKSGTVNITITKPVQEVHISVADLQYSWDKEGCTDCKSPAITRGCLFPMSTTQNIGPGGASGYLVWDNYTGVALPTSTAVTDCPEELIWKLGVMLQPGTYSIPIQLTLPKSVIEDCCKLHIDKFDIKVSLKDADCKVCESIVTPSTDDCCTGSKWIKKQMTWSLLTPIDTLTKTNGNKISNNDNDSKKLEEITTYNKLILNGDVIANPIPWYGVQDIECGKDNIYRLLEGDTRTFSGSFSCNPSLKNCKSEVLISIKTISGNYINVVNQPSAVVQTFALAGEYEVTYTGMCGGKKCDECTFKVIVDKNCCANVTKKSVTKVTTNKFNFNNVPTNQTTDLINNTTSLTTYTNAVVNLNYTCPSGCAPSYQWERIRNGVVIETQTSTSSTLSISPPTSGYDKIRITVKCGSTLCQSVFEEFNLGCSVCKVIYTGTHIKH